MQSQRSQSVIAILIVALGAWLTTGATIQAQLPSWNDTGPKRTLVSFVERVVKPGGADYVPPAERIAVFDNDGTLWCEQPMYVQLAFALDRAKALAGSHPEWKDKMPFRAALDRDFKALSDIGTAGRLELVMATHAGITTGDFTAIARDWLATARHPRFQRPY